MHHYNKAEACSDLQKNKKGKPKRFLKSSDDNVCQKDKTKKLDHWPLESFILF